MASTKITQKVIFKYDNNEWSYTTIDDKVLNGLAVNWVYNTIDGNFVWVSNWKNSIRYGLQSTYNENGRINYTYYL